MHRRRLISLIEQYQPTDSEEREMRSRMIDFVNRHEDCFERSLAIGHITGSAWIVNPKRTHIMLLHHRKLNRWLQPGGHSDGDDNTLRVALREAAEESGLPETAIKPISESIFDIDIHRIPARKNEAEHDHYDVRFLLEADDTIPFAISEESNDIAWIKLDDVRKWSTERSILRMLEKTPQK